MSPIPDVSAIDDFHAEASARRGFWALWGVAVLVGVMPVLAAMVYAVVIGAYMPERIFATAPPQDTAPAPLSVAPVPLPEEADRRDPATFAAVLRAPAAAADDTAGAATDPPPTPAPNPGVSETNVVPKVVADHDRFRAMLFFTAASFLYVGLGIVMLFAQSRVIRRHASVFWPRRRIVPPGPPSHPQLAREWPRVTASLDAAASWLRRTWRVRVLGGEIVTTVDQHRGTDRKRPYLWTPAWGALGAAIGLALFLRSDQVLPWLPTIFEDGIVLGRLRDWFAGGIGRVPQVLLYSGMIGIMFAAIVLSTFGTRLAARSYPPLRTSLRVHDRLRRAMRRARQPDMVAASGAWPRSMDEMLDPDGPMTPDAIATLVAAFWDRRTPPRTGIAPVARSMPPSELATIVRILSLALGLLMLVALVMLSLGFDVVEARERPAGASDDDLMLAAAVAASNHAWLLALGLSFSISLGACYVVPMMRLSPYIEAEEALRAAATPTGPEFPDDLRYYMGMSRSKFMTILSGSLYGGGFHMVLEKGLTRQILSIAGLLAPALTGGILALAE